MTKLPKNNHPQTQINSAKNSLQASTNIIFIDTAVNDYQSLIAGAKPGTEVVILDPNQDGVAQITEFLASRQSKSIQSIHIVSHGSAGSMQLGSTNLSSANLSKYANQLKRWSNVLTDDADILLYGCDVANGEGTKFVQQISQITGADVAASTDTTGNAALGGDWDLEVKTGNIEASLAFQPEVIQAYKSILPAGFTGTSTYTQNFDTLDNLGSPTWTDDSTITGWYAAKSSGGAQFLTYSAATGSDNAGKLYSFGSTLTDRALGSIASGSTGTIYYGLRLRNNTSSPITKLLVGYTGEQWRKSGDTSPQGLTFSYQTGTNLTSLTTPGWTSVASLNFTGPIATASAAALDGNLAANRVVITPQTITLATPLAVGEEIILRWEDINDPNADHGLAIDDVSIQVDNTIYIVTNTNDSGAGSLRQAIINANNDPGVETILFDTTGIFGDATPDTITLTSGQLNITGEVIIQGTGADKLTISGGGTSRVFNVTAPLTIDGLKITQGNAVGSTGGGINSMSNVTVSNSTISGNIANNGGGIYSNSTVTISNSTISGNTASANGGGIRSNSTVTVSNSTISGNTADTNGGGIRSNGGTISNSTITNNTADNDNNGSGNGGGISNSGTNTYTISNSIIAGNFDKGNQAPDIDGENLNGNAYNLVGSTNGKSSGTLGTGTDIVNPNPRLTPLGNYGGTTQTHSLEVDSLAANAGDPSYSGGLTTDQRGTGYNRIQGSVIDIGAFESNYTNTAPTLNNTGNPTLTAINEDVSNISNTGSLVSAIIASGAGGNPITDLDSGAVEGIAVTAVDNSNGTWQYSTDGGINWSNFTLSATSATLLRDTASDRIRFIPNPNFNGNANITFRAWDASDGNPSGTTGINPGTGGGATAFSTAIETARITVNPVNDTSFIVTNTNDSGIGSLRQAIIDANNDSGVETIRFDTTGIFGDATLDTIILTSGQLTITEEVIIQGTGADKLTISGGGGSRVFKATAPLTINGLKITQGNVSSGKGGGINSDSSVTLTNSIISDNTANTGGGIYSDGSVTLTNSTISDNVAGANGGGGIRSDVSVTVINSTISGNTADNNGGGIRSEGSVTVINSTISSNTANNNGGGIRSSGGTISNSTITNNTADNDNDGSGNGGGISNSGAATYTISNSIIAGNFDKGNEAPDIDGQNLNGNGYNLVGNLSGKSSGTLGTGVDIVNPNPKLKPLGNYGGTTQTHGLAFDSLAVNGGNPSYSGSLTNDQRGTGYDRIQNGKLDIGAFESVFPEASFGAATYNTTEGSTAIQINIPVSLDRIPEVDAIVPIQIKGSSTATKDVDYTISPNSLTFVAGSTGSDLTQLVTITIKPDDLPENAETVILYFGNLQEAIPGAITETTLNIAANDPIQYAISTANLSLTEGNTSKQTFTFTVTRSGGIGVASTVDYAFSGTASYNSDYNNILIRSGEVSLIGEFIDGDLSGTLNFAPGEKTKTITVDILGDKAFELNEDITVTLSNPNLTNAPENSTITTNQAKVDIINDDTQPSVNITDVSVTEGNTGALTNANFVVTLSNASYQQVVVNYSTSDDTAQVSDLDYNSGLGTIIFNPGETSKNISVGVRGDNKFEVNEKFSVNLFGAANAVITDSLGVAHIINDDNNQLPSIRISDVSVQEGYAAMITNATFAVTLSNPSFQQVIVNYSTSDGSARVSDSDYSSGLGTVIFNPGETSKNISFGVRGDTKRESNETFFVNLYGATNAAIADSQGVATIINDDF